MQQKYGKERGCKYLRVPTTKPYWGDALRGPTAALWPCSEGGYIAGVEHGTTYGFVVMACHKSVAGGSPDLLLARGAPILCAAT